MKKTFLLAFLFSATKIFACEFSLPPIFSDGMVLVHSQKNRISGKACKGEKIIFSINKRTITATADDFGFWQATLPALKPGDGYELQITAEHLSRTIKNISAGAVWLCSGQSNMEFELQFCATADADIPLATNEKIHLFDLKAHPRTDPVTWNADDLGKINRGEHFLPASWQNCTPQTARRFSAIGYYFAQKIQQTLQIPVGVICNAVGGSPTESWIPKPWLKAIFPEMLTDWYNCETVQPWVRERAAQNIDRAQNPDFRHPYQPAYLYESGIQPLAQFPINGVLWYQGESNAHDVAAHEKLFPALVAAFRAEWQNQRLPVYFVQLSSIDRPTWGEFRDSQRRLALALPNVEMAVSSDLGDSLDVHPKRKKTVGERLAALTLHHFYGKKYITPSGPQVKNVCFKNSVAVVSFNFGKNLKTADAREVLTLELAGDDNHFHPATAQIVGDKLHVSSPKVPRPTQLRYGYQPFTRANLTNGDGLPASTFWWK